MYTKGYFSLAACLFGSAGALFTFPPPEPRLQGQPVFGKLVITKVEERLRLLRGQLEDQSWTQHRYFCPYLPGGIGHIPVTHRNRGS